jgi:hypothetical protein
MPLYDSDNRPSIIPCDIEDANGKVISGKHVISFDTDTGVIVRHMLDENNELMECIVPPDGDISQQILYKDLPKLQIKDSDGTIIESSIKPPDKSDWLIRIAQSVETRKAPLKVIPPGR